MEELILKSETNITLSRMLALDDTSNLKTASHLLSNGFMSLLECITKYNDLAVPDRNLVDLVNIAHKIPNTNLKISSVIV